MIHEIAKGSGAALGPGIISHVLLQLKMKELVARSNIIKLPKGGCIILPREAYYITSLGKERLKSEASKESKMKHQTVLEVNAEERQILEVILANGKPTAADIIKQSGGAFTKDSLRPLLDEMERRKLIGRSKVDLEPSKYIQIGVDGYWITSIGRDAMEPKITKSAFLPKILVIFVILIILVIVVYYVR
jgi:hypothetical protein